MSEPVIDMVVYNELAETAGAEFAAELAGTFMEEAPGMLAELRVAQASAKADAFRRAASRPSISGICTSINTTS